MRIERVGDFTLGWGESLVWDERSDRLYFVDCAAQTLHWLIGEDTTLHTLQLPSMAAGIVPTDDGALIACLNDGLHRVDPDAGTTSLVTSYPDGLGGRANDACADLSGNLITGTLNLERAPGSSWWYSSDDGWRLLDPDISNTNGPAAGVLGGSMTLIIGDTSAQYFSYPYNPAEGTVGKRTVFGDVSALAGHPDGATLDQEGGLWCALFGGGQLARFTPAGLDRTVTVPAANPTDVTFGGPTLDRLYVVSVASANAGGAGLDGALLVIDGLGEQGRDEPRFRIGHPRGMTDVLCGKTNDRTAIGPRRGVRWFLAGYAGVTGFLALEGLVRQPGSASDLHASKDDDASTWGIVVAYALVLLSAPLLRRLPVRPLPALCAPLGVAVMVIGLVLRFWSMRTLSEAFTRTLRVTNQQTVTDRGPYRKIRHPGYLGSLLIWCGFAVASGSAVIVGTVAALLVPAYLHRIAAEEELLERDLPGYADYQGRTRRLVPHVW